MKQTLTRILIGLLVVGQPLPALAQAPGRFTTITITSTASDALKVGTASLGDTDLNKIDGITDGTAAASKALVTDANSAINILRTASLRIGVSGAETTVTATGAELNYLAGLTCGTVTASKALCVDSNKDLATFRHVTLTSVKASNTGLRALDSDATHYVTFVPGSNVTADRSFTVMTGDADRTLTLSGNPTLGDWFDQAVKVASSPTFAAPTVISITIGSASIDGTDATKIDGITNGTVIASKALVVDANKDLATIRNLTGNGALTFSGVGPHSIGASVDNAVQWNQSGTFSVAAATDGYLHYLASTLNLSAGASGYGITVGPTFVEAGSGNHPEIYGVRIRKATVTGGAATVGNTASFYVADAMSATVSGANYAMWIDAGTTRLDGDVVFGNDNTNDIGQNGTNRPKDVLISGKLYAQSGSSAAARFSGTADGVALLTDYAGTSFARLMFGGTTSSFPAWKRNGTRLEARFADDSAYTDLSSQSFNIEGTGGSGYTQFTEQGSDPSAPGANGSRLFAKDNGAGKTQLCVRFNTGSTQCFATEP